MNLTSRKKQNGQTPAETPEADTGPLAEILAARAILEDRCDEAERAADCLEQAEALRETVAGTVQGAEDRMAAAQAEADRLLADARRALAETRQRAAEVEARAAGIEDTGRSFQSAARLAGLIVEARRQADALAQERAERLTEAAGLQERLDGLAARQRAALASLAAAKSAVDVDAAGVAQGTLNGLEAVRPTLQAQHAAATARATAIGTEGAGGEYDAALAAVARFTREREQALDNARPERIEARYTANPGLRLSEIIATPGVLEAWTQHGAGQPKGNTPITRHADGRISGNVRSTR